MSAPIHEILKVNFGYASAQAEARECPQLLLEGYMDYEEVTKKIVNGAEWLILGYKGSGKSAVAERLRLIYENDSQTFINIVNLEDFEYLKFSRIIQADEPVETNLPTAWSWILYCFLLNSFFIDQSIDVPNADEYIQIQNSFKEMHLLPAYDIHNLVKISSESSFQLSIPRFAERKWSKKKQRKESDIRWYIHNLRKFISEMRSESRHFLIIDGLDDVLTTGPWQYNSIRALIFEANRVNQFLKENAVPAKVIILCRTDVFELLGGPNRNKIRQDYAVDLDWNTNPIKPESSMLIRIANLRAKIFLNKELDVFESYFPTHIGKKPNKKYLLDMTRHTPRDFLQLMRYIQKSIYHEIITGQALSNGLREYSNKYFLPEIFDELEGYIQHDEARQIVKAIGNIRSRDFTFGRLKQSASQINWNPKESDLERILFALYECSAIGNIRRSDDESFNFVTYRYRNRHSAFKTSETILLHRGLWRAFNLSISALDSNIKTDYIPPNGII